MAASKNITLQSYVRISDIDKEPQRKLKPIRGYEQMPLVTLEEAVEPLVSILPEVQTYADAAKKRCEPVPADGLTRDESASIILYSMDWKPVEECFYFVLNETLRTEDRRKLKPWFLYLKLILSALNRLPSSQRSVYRGIKMDLSEQYRQGETIIWWGFSSCMSSIEVLENDQFLGKKGTRTFFVIDCRSGKDIRRHSYYQSEVEFLLLPARQFQVVSCLQPESDLHVIHLKEIESPFTLLEPAIADFDTYKLSLGKEIDQPTNVKKNIQKAETPKTPSFTRRECVNVIDHEEILKPITNQIIQVLHLNDDENKYKIINDLIENGRQVLIKYQEDIVPQIYEKQMKENNNKLMKLLKKYFEQKWKLEYSLSNEWFILFLNEYKNGENHQWYEQVLTRTAEYGNKYMKNCPILSIVLQLLLEGIDNKCLEETNIFNELWFNMTNDGLQSIKIYSRYISKEIMNQVRNTNQSALFQALREYYRPELFQLLKQSRIKDKKNLCDVVLDNIAEYGWITGVQAIQDRITPSNFNLLLDNIQSFQQQQNVELQIEDNTESIEITAKSSATLPKEGKSWLDPQFHENNSIKKPHELEKEMTEPTDSIDEDLLNRIQGSMIGMALGDALGAHVEFRPHQYMLEHPVTDLQSGGTWGLEKGQFTDDTSMALCLANSLVARRGFVLYDQLVRYKWWHKLGYMSSTGECFDIGAATRQSVDEFGRRQKQFAKKHKILLKEIDYLSDPELLKEFDENCSSDRVAGNGALMRLAPVPLFFFRHPAAAVEFSGYSGHITHGDRKAYDACRYYGALIVGALHGLTKDQLLDRNFYVNNKLWFGDDPLHPDIKSIARGSYQKKGGYDAGIRGKGYIVSALEAALWAFWSDENSFEKGALAAVNLGDDTDTTAAIYGQLAGAYYGYKQLPERWLKHVYAKSFMKTLSKWIAYEGECWQKRFEASTPQS